MPVWELVWIGLLSAIPVGAISALIVLLRSRNILTETLEHSTMTDLTGAREPTLSQIRVRWTLLWGLLTPVSLGVASAWIYNYLSSAFGWSSLNFQLFATLLAVAFSILAYLRLYGGERNPFRVEWSLLNFTAAWGFSLLIPILAT